ncbi:hypothetical protein GQ53DRAFT_825933 [Thozetella sp. PMI_491]|nr:hypothetical protein GQ53DRAFT_825933 [Thozetella sp. PMI_491]
MNTAPPTSSSWQMAPQPATYPTAEGDDFGLQVRPMGLKVHYTFDREGQVHCLARWPQTLQIQTIPLDERNSIGVVDLKTCLQAIAQCSPEIVNQHNSDYTVYAHDYSEPDVPLVGQGMLSWGLDPNNDPQSQQLLTGRVTRNLLAIFANGIRETLEVKLKLTAVARMQRVESANNSMDQSLPKSAPTPTETTEWNSFLQSNPTLGHSANVAPMPSPSLRSVQLSLAAVDSRFPEPSQQQQQGGHQSHNPPSRPGSIPPRAASIPPASLPIPARATPGPDAAPSPVVAPDLGPEKANKASSRPSSRAGRRSKPPTGRPRGRPPKKAKEAGNTSAAEEATDADEGPHKKRAKLTRADSNHIAPFGSAPDSLRVAASTSGSLRNMRPIGSGPDASFGSHVQDIPRAPTPVPEAPLLQNQQRRRAPVTALRRGSTTDAEAPQVQPRFSQLNRHMSTGLDARSPTDSAGQSPDQCFTPEDSPADLGSSPPVPRTNAFLRSSPAPSSPILPPMPTGQVDSGFMSGGLDDVFDEEELQKEVARQLLLQNGGDILGLPALPPISRSNSMLNGGSNSRRGSQSQLSNQHPPSDYPFHAVNPGPPELLPTTSIYNPPSQSRPAAKAAAARARSKGRVGSTSSAPPARPPVPQLARSNTAPPPMAAEHEHTPRDQRVSQRAPEPEAPQLREEFLSLDIDLALPAPMPLSQTDEALLRELVNETAAATPLEDARPLTGTPAPTQDSLADAPDELQDLANPSMALTLPPMPASRSASRGSSACAIPASDPAPPASMLTLPQAPAPFSEAPCPPSDMEPRYNKNAVKKQSIKERLESAIERGEMPPFCNNCGAIETPTWRKIWTQDHDGVPPFHEFSDKPGFVTTIDVLDRDSEGKPSKYRLVKKSLGPKDPKSDWKESLLCNPCGIWLAKFKGHRPPDRWDKDAARLNQPRRKRENKGANSRSKKPKTKADGAMNPTSEAYFTTDPLGPMDQESPNEDTQFPSQPTQLSMVIPEEGDQQDVVDASATHDLGLVVSPKQQGPGSSHSRGSGTADSPIPVEDDLGATRRLLFPSPRKDGVPKILGELAVNMVQTSPTFQEPKLTTPGKENEGPERPATPAPLEDDDDGLKGLFGTPAIRPSTPPPKGNPGPFKTPTRPTPSHRPITRSISRSIRTVRSVPKSPSQALLQRTPTKTPRSRESNPHSASKRRTPARNQHLHAHFALGEEMHVTGGHFESPFTATLNQLLSEANDFTAGSPSHGLADLDLSSLPNIDSDAVQHHLASTGALDFGNFLSTDMVMPSSPPLVRNPGRSLTFGGSLSASVDIWAQLHEPSYSKDDGTGR